MKTLAKFEAQKGEKEEALYDIVSVETERADTINHSTENGHGVAVEIERNELKNIEDTTCIDMSGIEMGALSKTMSADSGGSTDFEDDSKSLKVDMDMDDEDVVNDINTEGMKAEVTRDNLSYARSHPFSTEDDQDGEYDLSKHNPSFQL